MANAGGSGSFMVRTELEGSGSYVRSKSMQIFDELEVCARWSLRFRRLGRGKALRRTIKPFSRNGTRRVVHCSAMVGATASLAPSR